MSPCSVSLGEHCRLAASWNVCHIISDRNVAIISKSQRVAGKVRCLTERWLEFLTGPSQATLFPRSLINGLLSDNRRIDAKTVNYLVQFG